MRNCCGALKRLPINSESVQKQSRALLITANCLLFGSEGLFASEYKQFTSSLSKGNSTMVEAWSRRYLNMEKAYATL